MANTINILIENHKSSNKPTTTVQLPFDHKAHKLSDLERVSGSTDGPILATNISVVATNGDVPQNVSIHFEGGPNTGHGPGYKADLKKGEAPYAISQKDGDALDVSGFYAQAS